MPTKLNFAFWTLPWEQDTPAMGKKSAGRRSGTRTEEQQRAHSSSPLCTDERHSSADWVWIPSRSHGCPTHTYPFCSSSSNSSQPSYSRVAALDNCLLCLFLETALSAAKAFQSVRLMTWARSETALLTMHFPAKLPRKLLAAPVLSEEPHPSHRYPVQSPNSYWTQIFKGFRFWWNIFFLASRWSELL